MQNVRKPNSGYVGQALERVLELSADARIASRKTPRNSPVFHHLTGEIAAYGKALALLAALQQREEFSTVIAQCEYPEGLVAVN
jgi:hypothetical protein